MKKDTIFICLFVILLLANINTFAQECLFITTADTVKSTEKT